MSQALLDMIIAWLPILVIAAVFLLGAVKTTSSYKKYLREHNKITEANTTQLSRIADALELMARK